jgi:tripartite-type tricarboxylate transporter receptor subunit TctC
MGVANGVLIVLVFCSSLVLAQSYPSRSIQLIMPQPAGGGGDVNGRILAEDLSKILGQQVVVTNKPGASETLGTDMVAKGKKDGYSLVYTGASPMVYSRVTNPETVQFDPIKDFDPIGTHTFFPIAVAVQASSPWHTFGELVEHAKKNPGKLRVSTAGVGSGANFNLEITQSLTGTQFTHVPFKGGEPVITALLGGHVEVSYDILAKFLPHVEAGKLRLLLVSKKVSSLPNLPTLRELGYSRDFVSGWHGIFGPAGMPEEAKRVLVPALERAVRQPESKAKIERLGYVVEFKPPEEVRKLIADHYETVKAIAVRLGLSK